MILSEDPAGLDETVDVLATPGALDAIEEGRAELDAGDAVDNVQLRARYVLA